MKQIGLAVHNYESAEGAFPPGAARAGAGAKFPFLGWLGHLLPQLEQDALWRATVVAYEERPGNPFRLPHLGILTPVKAFACPADSRQSEVHPTHNGYRVSVSGYLGVLGTNFQKDDGVFYYGSRTRFADIADGTSNTLAAIERPPSPDFWFGWWYAGAGNGGGSTGDMVLGVRDLNISASPYTAHCPRGPYTFRQGKADDMCATFHFWSLHTGGANALLCDGSVRFLPYAADAVLPQAATRAGGEVVTLE